jgi:tight adherence protein B
MHILFMAGMLVLGGAAMLACYSVYLLWRDQYSSGARDYASRIVALGRGADTAAGVGEGSILKQAAAPGGGAALHGMAANLDWMLRQAGPAWTLRRFGLYSALGAAAGAVGGGVLGLQIGVCGVLLCVGAVLPYGIARRRSQQRTAALERQLPDVLDMMASILGAGHALPATLALLGNETPAPMGEEFRTLHGEITYGSSTEEALHHLIERTRNEDIRCLVMAILIQRETGGKLTEVLQTLGGVVRERLKLQGKIRSLSAEGRLSAWVLTLLPVVTGVVINFEQQDYLRYFWTNPTGIKLLYAMIVMLVLGNLLMRKIVQVRV